MVFEWVMPALEKMSFIVSQLPLPYILASMLLAFIILYTLANKMVSMVLVGAAQFALYYNAREQLEVLAEMSPTNAKVINQTIMGAEILHPLIYMDKALKVATIVPDGLEQYKLIYPILLSSLIIFMYFIYIFMGRTSRAKAKQIVPVLALLLTFGILGGGEGLWRYLSVNKFFGVGYNWMLLFFVAIYLALVLNTKKRRSD